jgi:hypothetical protein
MIDCVHWSSLNRSLREGDDSVSFQHTTASHYGFGNIGVGIHLESPQVFCVSFSRLLSGTRKNFLPQPNLPLPESYWLILLFSAFEQLPPSTLIAMLDMLAA